VELNLLFDLSVGFQNIEIITDLDQHPLFSRHFTLEERSKFNFFICQQVDLGVHTRHDMTLMLYFIQKLISFRLKVFPLLVSFIEISNSISVIPNYKRTLLEVVFFIALEDLQEVVISRVDDSLLLIRILKLHRV
jgi:hypothetical protein